MVCSSSRVQAPGAPGPGALADELAVVEGLVIAELEAAAALAVADGKLEAVGAPTLGVAVGGVFGALLEAAADVGAALAAAEAVGFGADGTELAELGSAVADAAWLATAAEPEPNAGGTESVPPPELQAASRSAEIPTNGWRRLVPVEPPACAALIGVMVSALHGRGVGSSEASASHLPHPMGVGKIQTHQPSDTISKR